MNTQLAKCALLGALASLLPAAASARHLSADEALQRFQASSGPHKVAPAKAKLLDLTYSCDGGYVFAQDSTTFYVLPADDALPAVIGYGDAPAAEIPPAMKWWLSTVASSTVASVSSHDAISPLVQTKWNQGAPYNNLCPFYSGSRSVTGCVATATAQVLKYHNLPATKGTGSYTHTWNGQTMTFDYANTTFDWANMLNEYKSGAYSAAQANAVATLMYGVGVGVHMQYSPSESGAFSCLIPEAVRNYFGADKGVGFLMRDYFSTEDWDEIIYNELAAARPVIYSGNVPSGGGHCFVCDGYSSNGYYHINWGWGGSSDGYFLLTALNPRDQGTGSYEGGYNAGQSAVVGLQAPQPDSQVFLPFYTSLDFQYMGSNYWGFFDEAQNSWIYTSYLGLEKIKYYTGIKMVNDEGEAFYFTGQLDTTNPCTEGENVIKYGYSFYQIKADVSSVPAGNYKAYPVVRPADGSEWQQIFINPSAAQYVTVRKGNNGVVTYDGSDPNLITSPIKITNIEQTEDLVNGESGRLSATCVNLTAESTTCKVGFWMINTKSGVKYNCGSYWNLSFDPGETVSYGLPKKTWTMPVGAYKIYAYDLDNDVILSDEYIVHVGVRPTNVSMSHSEITLGLDDQQQFDVFIEPTSAYDKTITWTIDDPSIVSISPVSKLRTAEPDASVVIKPLNAGSTYVNATTVNGLVTRAKVTVDPTVSIVEIESQQGDAAIYDLQGRRVTAPVRGSTYIINGKKVKE